MMPPDYGWTPEVMAEIDLSILEFRGLDRTRFGWWRETLIGKFSAAYETGYLTDREINLLSMLPKHVQERLCTVYIQEDPLPHLGLMPIT